MTTHPGSDISSEDVDHAVAILQRLKPGFLPFPIFNEVARLTVLPIVDIVPIRRENGVTQVLLTQREEDDPFWPGMWHNPGTVVRATDSGDYTDAFARVIESELGIEKPAVIKYAAHLFHHTNRGAESSRIYWAELPEQPRHGKYFSIDNLPKDVIQSHLAVLEAAVKAYSRHRKD